MHIDITKRATHDNEDHSLAKERQKDVGVGHVEYKGTDTGIVMPGTNNVYEKKIVIMNEALIDIGMGSYQWKIFLATGFGWFVDNVSHYAFLSLLNLTDLLLFCSFGCRQ